MLGCGSHEDDKPVDIAMLWRSTGGGVIRVKIWSGAA